MRDAGRGTGSPQLGAKAPRRQAIDRPLATWRLGARTAALAGAAALLVLLTILTLPASAQEEGTLPRGAINLTDELIVQAGERLLVESGTSVSGAGSITVWGELVVNGTAGSPVEFAVPIRVLGNGSVEMRQARLWGASMTALEVLSGDVRLEDTLLEANSRGAIVKGTARFHAERVVFRDHAGEGLYVEESADVRLVNATFSSNGRGATVYSAARFHVNGSTFLANGQHLVVDLGPWSSTVPDLVLAEDRFAAPSPTPARLPGILLRYDTPLVDQGARRLIRLEGNHIEGAAIGLRAEGRGLIVESTRDTLVGNEIGLSVQLATVRLDHVTLGNDRDVEGSGRVTLESATYLHADTLLPQPTARGWWTWWTGGALAALLVAGAIAVPLLFRGRTRPAPAPLPARVEPVPEPAPPAPPAPDLTAALTAVERRILEDIVAHPGTAQRAVADRLGYTRQALHYHVKKLEARGLVSKTVEGRETRCMVPPAVASMLSSTPVTHNSRTGSQEKA